MELNGRKINVCTVQVDGTPDWVGGGIHFPYFSHAEYADGQKLTEDDLEELNQSKYYDCIHEWL